MPGPADNRSLGELMSELSRETGTLVRKELELATTEITGNLRKASVHATRAAVGGALLHAGLLVILAALVAGLVRIGVDTWLAALIVALVTIGAGYMFVQRGVDGLKRTQIAPRQTIESLKENAQWTTGQGR